MNRGIGQKCLQSQFISSDLNLDKEVVYLSNMRQIFINNKFSTDLKTVNDFFGDVEKAVNLYSNKEKIKGLNEALQLLKGEIESK